jgi:hypothetical protein
VIDLATAMEILFSQLIATGGTAAAWTPARIQRANKESTNLRGRVQDHLGPLLGANIDVEDGRTIWGEWWRFGYRCRNRAVHRGERLDDAECRKAWLAATRLIRHIVTVLTLQPDLEAVAELLGAIEFGEPDWRQAPVPADIDWF